MLTSLKEYKLGFCHIQKQKNGQTDKLTRSDILGRKPSFNKISAIEMFKVGMNYEDIAQQLNSTSEAIRKVIKRDAAELNKKPINKYEVAELFENGMSYEGIAQKLNSTNEAIRKIIKRNSPELLKKRKESQQSKLFEPTPEEFNLVSLGRLSIEDRMQLMNERTYGINNSESMSTKALLDCIWQSFKTDKKTGRVKFDTSRGAKTKDVPSSYMPGAEFKNKFNCLIINSNGESSSINVRAYDNFDARKEARRKVNNIAILRCENIL